MKKKPLLSVWPFIYMIRAIVLKSRAQRKIDIRSTQMDKSLSTSSVSVVRCGMKLIALSSFFLFFCLVFLLH
jgi:hypothetical protein